MILIPPDLTNISNIRRYKQQHEFIQDYYFKHFMYFQNERSKKFEQIKSVILNNSKSYTFKNWHRIIDLKFVEDALSSIGSVLSDPGGRFNIGDINEIKFSKFPALYIAEDYATAYREKNQVTHTSTVNGLSADELSFTNAGSTVDLLVKGEIESVIDLTEEKLFTDFFEIIKGIKLPKSLEVEAKKLNITTPYHVKSVEDLKESILKDGWRDWPMQVDIPANSQILGQLIHSSGIEAILYPSKTSTNKKCLAIFPKNFSNSMSYVKIQDHRLPPNIKYTELNSESYFYL